MYSIVRFVLGIIFRLLYRLQITGTKNIPQSGGVIIAANHVSLLDPPVIGLGVPREIHFMAKEELFKIPILGFLIRHLNAFPVKRGNADRNAIRTAINVLNNGNVLGVFPEGTRSKTGDLGAAEPGVALLALKTCCPIVPTAVIGTNKIKKGQLFPKFRVIYGKPLYFNEQKIDKVSIDNINALMMTEIAKLLAEGY